MLNNICLTATFLLTDSLYKHTSKYNFVSQIPPSYTFICITYIHVYMVVYIYVYDYLLFGPFTVGTKVKQSRILLKKLHVCLARQTC